MREILSCPGVRALLQAHDVVAHEVYGEEAVRVTPPNSTVNLTVGDDVEGPNGECPQVQQSSIIKQKLNKTNLEFYFYNNKNWHHKNLITNWGTDDVTGYSTFPKIFKIFG